MPKIKVGINRKKFSYKEFMEIAEWQLYHFGFNLVQFAYRLAKYGHQGQYRLDKTRYFEHPKAVALIIMLECGVYLPEPIIVALMHDLDEESNILIWWDVEHCFGKDICRGLRLVTKGGLKDYYAELKRVQSDDWWIQLVKLADILHNMRTMQKTNKAFRTRQLEEKEREYVPLLESMAKNIPDDRKHIIDYLRKEIGAACDRVRDSLKKVRIKKDPSV